MVVDDDPHLHEPQAEEGSHDFADDANTSGDRTAAASVIKPRTKSTKKKPFTLGFQTISITALKRHEGGGRNEGCAGARKMKSYAS
jgi:hypothetical protein